MTTFLAIGLCMSVVLNVLLFNAWSQKDSNYRELKEAFDDLQKIYSSIERTVKKHQKLIGGKK